MLLTLGTRGSKLSLIQTDMIAEKLKRENPTLTIRKKIIATSGDVDRRTPLFSLNQKGIFEKEIDQAVLDGSVDFAVHSLKDVPVFEQVVELVVASVPKRGSPLDILVSKRGETLKELKHGGRVGTSSLLRVAQLRRARPDLQAEPIRGNVETRVQKVDRGEFDAVILAEAGLDRLGMRSRISERLSVKDFMPAPGQGTLALVTRNDNARVIETLKTVEHPSTRAEAEAEREAVRVLEGGCKVPIGALATVSGNRIEITACILSATGKEKLIATDSGHVRDAATLGRTAGQELMAKGAKKIEETWRDIYR